MVDRDLIRFYFDTMSLNEHLMQWYRAVFVAFEGGIILAMLFKTELSHEFILHLVILGLILSFAWVWLTSQRERIVNRQMDSIRELTKADKGLSHCLKIYDPDLGWPRHAAPFIFNFCLPVVVGFLLIFVLWRFSGLWEPCLSGTLCLLIAVIFVALLILARWKWNSCGVPKDD